jgi:TonB family protein
METSVINGLALEGKVVEGKLTLLEYLGGTEESAAFRTELPDTGRRAAIKLIPLNPATADAQLARWKRAANLSHPHLLRVLHGDRCELEGTEYLFVITEFAEENVAQILPSRSLTISETLVMLEPTLAALGYLHANGFVHGDLKPANIMAAADQLKLSSDSISQAGERRLIAAAGSYDPPEMASVGASPAGDVWSLGGTLLEVLTQLPPPLSRNADPVIPQTIPSPLNEIVHNCLRRDPSQRWTVSQIMAHINPSAAPLPTPTAVAPPKADPQPPASVKTKADVAARPISKAERVDRPIEAPVPKRQASAPLPPRRRSPVIPIVIGVLVLAAVLFLMGLLHRTPDAASDQSAATVPVDTAPVKQAPQTAANRPTQQVPAVAPAPASRSRNIDKAATNSPTRPEPTTAEQAEQDETPVSESGVARRVLPQVPQRARNTIQGTVRVRVRVHVDASGNVTDAEFVSPGPSKYFAKLAMQAARQWKFAPQSAGGAAARQWILQFGFRRNSTNVVPTSA